MKLIADTHIEQEVPHIHLDDIEIAGKNYALTIYTCQKNGDWAKEDGLRLHFYCKDKTEFWMCIDKEIHINRDSDPVNGERKDREAFLSRDGAPYKWLKWSECSGQESGREKGVEFGFPKKEATDETAS